MTIDDDELFAVRRSMNRFRINPSTSALLLVDLQYGSASPDYGFSVMYRQRGFGNIVDAYAERVESVVIPTVQRLLTAFRCANAAVVYLTVGTLTGDYSDMPRRMQRAVEHWRERGIDPPYARAGTKEMTVLDELAPGHGEPVVAKTSASAFTSSTIQQVLTNGGIRELVIAGVATNYCVQSTLRDAAERGYDCVLVEDGCADTTPELHDMGIASCEPFCRVMRSDDVIAELASAGEA